MFNKVKEFFMKLFGKTTKNDTQIQDIEKVISNNPELKNKKIEVTNVDKFDKIVDNATKQGKRITAKQIIAAAGITTVTVGSAIMLFKKFKKNTPNDLNKKEKEAIKEIEKEEKKQKQFAINNNKQKYVMNKQDYSKMSGKEYPKKVNNKEVKFVVNKTPIGLPEGASEKEQLLLKYQNQLEQINAEIKYNKDVTDEIYNKIMDEYDLIANANKNIIRKYGGQNHRTNEVIPYPKTGKITKVVKKRALKELYKKQNNRISKLYPDMSESEFISIASPYYDRYLNTLDDDPDTGNFKKTEESRKIMNEFYDKYHIDLLIFPDYSRNDINRRIYSIIDEKHTKNINKLEDDRNSYLNKNEQLYNKRRELENKINNLK